MSVEMFAAIPGDSFYLVTRNGKKARISMRTNELIGETELTTEEIQAEFDAWSQHLIERDRYAKQQLAKIYKAELVTAKIGRFFGLLIGFLGLSVPLGLLIMGDSLDTITPSMWLIAALGLFFGILGHFRIGPARKKYEKYKEYNEE